MSHNELDDFYITGQGRVIHWECDWSVLVPSMTPSVNALNGAARAHLRQGCVGKRRYLARDRKVGASNE